MENLEKIILQEIKSIEIDCPDCESMGDDDQYTCTVCWCEGGNGKINLYEWLKEHPKFLLNLK